MKVAKFAGLVNDLEILVERLVLINELEPEKGADFLRSQYQQQITQTKKSLVDAYREAKENKDA